mmetsp:Transcript_8143/g.10948  ORF Transcript_8143/g.10948 Transcript_8143/m.10948 type:complete len:218 (-) Transcript_8143:130-783(-)
MTIMNKAAEYGSIPEVHMEDDDSSVSSSSVFSTRRMAPSSKLWIGLGVAAACALIFGASSNSTATTATSQAGFVRGMGIVSFLASTTSTGTRNCTLEECFASSCNTQVAPFTCLFHNGGPHGGCSDVVWTAATCTEQCDLSGCANLDIPEDTDSCAGTECGEEWCTSGRTCGLDVSFQCTNGSARFGCSSDELQWTLRTSTDACSNCCDVSLCQETS